MYPFLKYIVLFVVALFVAECGFSQVNTNWVIGSAGNHKAAGNLMVSYTVGEPMITTATTGNFIFTQGFHQPSALTGSLLINSTKKNASCLTAKNGEATMIMINGTAPFNYTWSHEDGSQLSTGTTSGSFTATGLAPGTYILYVSDAMSNPREGRDTITIGSMADDACEIHVYGGITPNADGINDDWHIDGITIFPDNTVTIYNRWGEKAWNAEGYNNADKLWKGQDLNNDLLPDGTYFYILEIPGLDTFKGWVQVTR